MLAFSILSALISFVRGNECGQWCLVSIGRLWFIPVIMGTVRLWTLCVFHLYVKDRAELLEESYPLLRNFEGSLHTVVTVNSTRSLCSLLLFSRVVYLTTMFWARERPEGYIIAIEIDQLSTKCSGKVAINMNRKGKTSLVYFLAVTMSRRQLYTCKNIQIISLHVNTKQQQQ